MPAQPQSKRIRDLQVTCECCSIIKMINGGNRKWFVGLRVLFLLVDYKNEKEEEEDDDDEADEL